MIWLLIHSSVYRHETERPGRGRVSWLALAGVEGLLTDRQVCLVPLRLQPRHYTVISTSTANMAECRQTEKWRPLSLSGTSVITKGHG